MSLDALIDNLPSSAKDLKLNYSSLVRNNTELTAQQLWGTVAASAIATRCAALTAAVLAAAARSSPPQALEAAKTVAAVMGMNNIFYRFQHLSSNPKYSTMGARLRMNGLRGHGVEEVDFELWSLAVSAINGCGKCVDAHEKSRSRKRRQRGTGAGRGARSCRGSRSRRRHRCGNCGPGYGRCRRRGRYRLSANPRHSQPGGCNRPRKRIAACLRLFYQGTGSLPASQRDASTDAHGGQKVRPGDTLSTGSRKGRSRMCAHVEFG